MAENDEDPFAGEWLETDGLGGYALATPSGLLARRYHGLLVAATDPPAGRSVLLSKLEESLVVGEKRVDLSVNLYGDDTLHPRGDRYLVEFRRFPFPTVEYEVGGVHLVKTVALLQGETTAVVTYELHGTTTEKVSLEVRPLVAFRDHHALSYEDDRFASGVTIGEGFVTIRAKGSLPALVFAHDARSSDAASFWYHDFTYAVEKARGFDFSEDLFAPFTLTFDLSASRTARLVVSTGHRTAAEAEELLRNEALRRSRVGAGSVEETTRGLLQKLRKAADQFLVKRGEGRTVIAGYPWFTDWGRDTMISLPGLTLSTGRPDVARSLLSTFASFVDRGMIPNRFPDAGEAPEYNTVDGTLWFVQAVRAYVDATGDTAFSEELYPLLLTIVEEHLRGTRYGIRADEDGLLLAGEEGVQLTWMDARIGTHVVTPRHGKPVEIQALWYSSLRFLAELAGDLGDRFQRRRLLAITDKAWNAFGELFWNEEASCLYDVVGPDGRGDPAIRPNQLFALSLPYPLIGDRRGERTLETVEKHLLTPYGLRTLSPEDPSYRGRYEGDGAARDGAYHQGTVWPWLIGPYVDACLAVRGDVPVTRWDIVQKLRPLCEFFLGPGNGQLPEIFDGDAPYRPNGCPAQAWSVAELLRVLSRLGTP